MELKNTLRAISDDARGWLNVWAKDFTEAEALEPGPDGRAPNPLAWQLGHIACVEDDVAQFFSTHSAPLSLVPPALRQVCGTGSPAPTGATRYLRLTELWPLLEQTHARLLDLLEAAQPADLDRGPRVANPYFHSFGQGLYEAALHENYHVGEIAALRKVLGKSRIA
jgi:hypothetical protein